MVNALWEDSVREKGVPPMSIWEAQALRILRRDEIVEISGRPPDRALLVTEVE